jgi:hypothetical protein
MSVAHRGARLRAALVDRLTFACRSSKRHTGYPLAHRRPDRRTAACRRD